MNPPTGVDLIAAERRRQVSAEGFDAKNDDQYLSDELVDAASCYIYARSSEDDPSGPWPFPTHWWRPSDDRVRNLVKAGALIAAEIDRLQRQPQAATA